jgi:hypothetical protein
MRKHWGRVDGKDEAEVRAWWRIQCWEDIGCFNIMVSDESGVLLVCFEE